MYNFWQFCQYLSTVLPVTENMHNTEAGDSDPLACIPQITQEINLDVILLKHKFNKGYPLH